MNPLETDALTQLLDTARTRTVESRNKLFDSISDLFLASSAVLSEQQRTLMLEILTSLISDAECQLRKDLAIALADAPDVPRELVLACAHSTIDVARPLLMHSPLLQDRDLIEIVQHRSQEHLLAVAARQNLSADVTDALVEYGNRDVLARLIQNPDSQLSRKALDYLVAESRRNDQFHEPLLQRADLPPEVAHRLFWWVSAALRRHIIAQYAVEPCAADSHLVAAARRLERQASTPSADHEARALAAYLDEVDQLDAQLMLDAVRSGRIPLFMAAFARLTQIDMRTARRIVFDPHGEPFAIACRAINLNRQAFSSLFLLARQGRGRPSSPGVIREILDFYDHLVPARAARALSFWRADTAYLDALGDGADHGKPMPGPAA